MNPSFFLDQLKLKFGKPRVPSLEEHEKMVKFNFKQSMNDNDKKKSGDFAATGNSVLLVRHRVHRFYEQQCSNSKQTKKGNKSKRHPAALPKEQESAKIPSNRSPTTSAHEKASPGFFKGPSVGNHVCLLMTESTR